MREMTLLAWSFIGVSIVLKIMALVLFVALHVH